MTETGWRIRLGNPGDRALLASFACADPSVRWQTEVEQFIQTQLTDWAFDPHADAGDPRLLLAFTAAGDLFGVAAHERVILRAGDGNQLPCDEARGRGSGAEVAGAFLPPRGTRQRRPDVGGDDRRALPRPAP